MYTIENAVTRFTVHNLTELKYMYYKTTVPIIMHACAHTYMYSVYIYSCTSWTIPRYLNPNLETLSSLSRAEVWETQTQAQNNDSKLDTYMYMYLYERLWNQLHKFA